MKKIFLYTILFFLFCGRLITEKGILEFLKAASIIKKKYTNIHFQIAGEIQKKSMKSISINLLNEYENKGIIQYLGFSNDVLTIINKCDCLILPSYREGLSRVLLEASMLAKPIITSNVTGCRDVVKHNYSGYLCKPKSVDDLVFYIEKFINLSNEEKAIFGINGKNLVKIKFDERLVIDKYINIMFNV